MDLLESTGYEGLRHFDYKPMRTEDISGVWASAAANMRTYLMLRERARAFRADPRVQEALAASAVPDLSTPTLSAGESWRDVPTFDAFDPQALASRGHGYAHLDQLAIEHLMGGSSTSG